MSILQTSTIRTLCAATLSAVAVWMVSPAAQAGPSEEAAKAYKRGDVEAALKLWKRAADAGDAVAMNNLGFIYSTVRGDHKTAMKFWRDAAEAGNVDAMNNLGLAYDLGKGVPRSDKLALFWFLKAARKGFTRALYNLGRKYDNGEGVAANEVTAYMFFILAASAGEQAFAVTRDKLGQHLTPAQKQTAHRLAREWVDSAGDN